MLDDQTMLAGFLALFAGLACGFVGLRAPFYGAVSLILLSIPAVSIAFILFSSLVKWQPSWTAATVMASVGYYGPGLALAVAPYSIFGGAFSLLCVWILKRRMSRAPKS